MDLPELEAYRREHVPVLECSLPISMEDDSQEMQR